MKTKNYLREAGDASNVTFSPAQDSSRSEESSNTLSSYKNSDILKQISLANRYRINLRYYYLLIVLIAVLLLLIYNHELEPTEVINVEKCQVSLRKSSYSRADHHREPMTFF